MTARTRGLDGYITDRRRELGLSQSRAASLAGVSRTTWVAWEKGTATPEDYNHVKIERPLEWQPGSVEGILTGGAPTVIPKKDRSPDEISDEEVEDALAVLRAGLKRLYPPDEVERRIARERQEIADARAARARRQRPAG